MRANQATCHRRPGARTAGAARNPLPRHRHLATSVASSAKASGAASDTIVHLSADPATARIVGQRHGEPIVLRIAAATMRRDGHLFYRSANGVWLTDAVPPSYLSREDQDGSD
ncbi:MAG: RNA 2'-phosphotransferase [Chloroflexia bacterium]